MSKVDRKSTGNDVIEPLKILRACCAVKYWKHNSIFRSCKKKSKSEDEAKANCHEPVYEMEKDESFEESLRVIGQSLKNLCW